MLAMTRNNEYSPREDGPASGDDFGRFDFSAPFIRRPVATTLLTIALALAGIVAFRLLPVAPLPQMDFPVVVARAGMPGASPETMAATVATPLERALGRIAGVNEMTSTSSLGSSDVILQFDLDRDINGAARDVQAAINAARSTLPTMPSNPTYRKVNPAGAPIMILSVSSDVLTRAQLYDAASTILAQKISQIPGVGEVTVGGGAMPAVRVEAIPDAVNRLGVSMDDIRQTISRANAYLPKGAIENENESWLIGANDQLMKASDYEPLVVASKDGRAIRLKDVARIIDDSQNSRNMALANGAPAILLIIFRSPGANIIETVDRIKDMLPQLASWLPESADLRLRMDRSVTIRASLKEVEKSLVLAMALVVLVTFLFLRNLRATAIPAVAAPVSLIATFGVMYLCDYSLDNLSLMALTVSTGFVVDDAIVVLENIVRRIEAGDSPLQAALKGSREVGFTVISISISLVAVFMPIIFMGGVIGRLFQEFAIVLSAAVLVSMLVSLTTTPMMCASLLRPYSDQISKRKKYLRELKKGGLKPLVKFFFAGNLFLDKTVNGLRDAYASSLRVALDHPRLTLASLFLIIALNIWLYIYIPKGFFPQQDTGVIMGGIRADQSASYQSLTGKIERLVNMIKSDPAVEEVSAHISGARAGGGVFIALKPLDERKISAQGVVARLRDKLVSVPGLQIFLHPAQDIMMGGRSSRSGYQYTLQADDLDQLREWGRKLQDAISHDPLFKDVNSDIEERGLQTMINVDRDAMARLGVTMAEVDSALNNAFGQRQISTIYQDKNQYRVVLEYDKDWLNDARSLEKVYIDGRSGLVPLLSFATVGPGFAPLSVAHQGQFAAVTISFNLDPGVSLSQAQEAIDKLRVKIGMPSTIVGSFQGTAKMFTDTLNNQILMIVAALVALYITLGILYESLIHPITILSTLPSAGVGALLALMLFHMEFSVIALIGVLLLAGIVKKNAIMLIDFALHAQRTKNIASKQAIYEACLLRFRPIIMTTAAAVMGAIPLAIGRGDGAEIRQPLGIAIVGGLLVSQALTLYTTPVVYIYLDKWRESLAKRLKKSRGNRETTVAAPSAN